MNKRHTAQSAFFNSRIVITLLLCAIAACSLVSRPLLPFFRPEASTKDSQRTLTFPQRVAYQRAIEEVYWRHRIWPKERLDPKPSLDAVMSQAQLENKVTDYLRKSQTLADYWQRPVTAEQLQAEMDRMAKNTEQPDVLRELFEALGNDPYFIAECLARPALAERLETQGTLEQLKQTNQTYNRIVPATATFILPIISDTPTGCIDNSWTATSSINAHTGRFDHTAVWTGIEMIVWGGNNLINEFDTGGRYNPGTDSWTATSTTNVPTGRSRHTAVWTGSHMIVWGGVDFVGFTFNTGGNYNPSTNTWTPTTTANAPATRTDHTAVWTGTEMIIWGGWNALSNIFNGGGRYNPVSDSWTATSTSNTPSARYGHTAVWTGGEMIVWGGGSNEIFGTGAQYNPRADTWMATSTTNAPTGRASHTAEWTGTEMIVWGGFGASGVTNTGGRYNPDTNSWTRIRQN